MRKTQCLALAILLATSSLTANALTAVCKNPSGRMLGIHGKALAGKPVDEPDGISNATFTLIWTVGAKQAQLVSQSAGGGTPETTHPVLVFDTDKQLTFVVLYESAIWFYSLYVGPKVLIMTSHNNGAANDSGGAISKNFIAKCEIGE